MVCADDIGGVVWRVDLDLEAAVVPVAPVVQGMAGFWIFWFGCPGWAG